MKGKREDYDLFSKIYFFIKIWEVLEDIYWTEGFCIAAWESLAIEYWEVVFSLGLFGLGELWIWFGEDYGDLE